MARHQPVAPDAAADADLRRPTRGVPRVTDPGRDKGQHEGELAQERTVDVQITRLRRKIEADQRKPRYLQTARGSAHCASSVRRRRMRWPRSN